MKHLKKYTLFESTSIEDLSTSNGWTEKDSSLVKDFGFKSFREAQDFINRVADIAESQNHHPKIEWLYDKVQLSLSTHDAGDTVTNKDIKLANSINSIYENN